VRLEGELKVRIKQSNWHTTFSRQLIEINTTDSVGNVTTAAEAMAKRLRDGGFAEDDIKVAGPNERKRISSRVFAEPENASPSFSSGTLMWSKRSDRTGPPILSNSSKKTATSTAAARKT